MGSDARALAEARATRNDFDVAGSGLVARLKSFLSQTSHLVNVLAPTRGFLEKDRDLDGPWDTLTLTAVTHDFS